MFKIEFYKTENGVIPVVDFLNSLSPKMRAKAARSLQILEDLGNELREPYSKHIANGIFELRIKLSNDICRVFYFFYAGERIVMTNGFVKKTLKTPKLEIAKALKCKQDWETRNT